MIVFDWLNYGSLVFGLLAWIIPVVNFKRHETNNHKHWVTLSVMSVSSCAISLCFQIFFISHVVKVEEWPTLMDTMGAVAVVSAVLVTVTIVLNAITLILYHEQTAR